MLNLNNYNISSTILSTFIHNFDAIKYINLLESIDFLNKEHRIVFESIKSLDDKNIELDPILILNECDNSKQIEDELVKIMSVTPVPNVQHFISILKQQRLEQKIQSFNSKIASKGNVDYSKLTAMVEELERLKNGEIKELKKIDSKIDNIFDNFDLQVDKLKNLKFEYLYDNFIVKNEITMVAAKPSSGKSLTTLALSNMCLERNQVDRVIYFDLDNSLTTLKNRGLDTLKNKWQNRFRYFHSSFASKSDIWQLIKQLQKIDLSDCLIVFDSAKNFINGDRDKNKDVSKLTDVFKRLRDNGATVLFLHHTNKPQKDIETMYAGSSAWEEDSSNAFILQKNDDKNTFIFNPIKNRVGELEELAFTYHQETHTLSKVDLFNAKETKEDEEIRDEIIEYIKKDKSANYSKLSSHCMSLGYSKNRVNKVIQDGKGRYWNESKSKENNRSSYTLIIQEQKETVVQFKPTDSELTSIISTDKSDKSGKSINRGFASTNTTKDKLDKSPYPPYINTNKQELEHLPIL
jgi:replicative DNA helicase